MTETDVINDFIKLNDAFIFRNPNEVYTLLGKILDLNNRSDHQNDWSKHLITATGITCLHSHSQNVNIIGIRCEDHTVRGRDH